MLHSPELIILDVGHGNCAILRDTHGWAIIDCAQGPTLLETLEMYGAREISYVIVSHADEDHVAGLLALLCREDIRIGEVYINPDATKRTKVWQGVRRALDNAHARFGTRARLGLTTQYTGELSVGEVVIEVLSPAVSEALSGPGGQDDSGRRIDSNSASIVIGLIHNEYRVALLAGDMDERSLENIQERTSNLGADVLVYPHHGGSAGRTDNEAFAGRLSSLTQPKLVVFSLGRERFDNPREDVIRGIRRGAPVAHVMCTQLARACAAELPPGQPGHLTELPARGGEHNRCCGGTISIRLNGADSVIAPSRDAHLRFIRACAPTARCMHVMGEGAVVS